MAFVRSSWHPPQNLASLARPWIHRGSAVEDDIKASAASRRPVIIRSPAVRKSAARQLFVGRLAREEIMAATDPGGFAAARRGIELDGQFAGWVALVQHENEAIGRHFASASDQRNAIRISCGAAMSADFYRWLQSTTSRAPSRRNGAISTFDFAGRPRSRLAFSNALISEVCFPSLDAASASAAMLTIVITPEKIEYEDAGNVGTTAELLPNDSLAERLWPRSAFRLAIDGLDCSKVSEVASLALKPDAGRPQDARLDVISSEAGAVSFRKWYEDTGAREGIGQNMRKAGHLEFLLADLQTSVFTLAFGGLEIAALRVAPAKSGEGINHLLIEMTFESVVIALL
jgi:hypothetical protein